MASRGSSSGSGARDKLGPIVFQLPGRFKPDRERLVAFLEALPAGCRYAFEFRDPAWFQPEILEVLAARNVALCLYEFAGQQAPLEVTADFVYIRLHGPGGAYQGSYGDAALRTWAKRIRGWAKAGRDVYATSTMTTVATHRTMPCACGTCWREVASSSCPRVLKGDAPRSCRVRGHGGDHRLAHQPPGAERATCTRRLGLGNFHRRLTRRRRALWLRRHFGRRGRRRLGRRFRGRGLWSRRHFGRRLGRHGLRLLGHAIAT